MMQKYMKTIYLYLKYNQHQDTEVKVETLKFDILFIKIKSQKYESR